MSYVKNQKEEGLNGKGPHEASEIGDRSVGDGGMAGRHAAPVSARQPSVAGPHGVWHLLSVPPSDGRFQSGDVPQMPEGNMILGSGGQPRGFRGGIAQGERLPDGAERKGLPGSTFLPGTGTNSPEPLPCSLYFPGHLVRSATRDDQDDTGSRLVTGGAWNPPPGSHRSTPAGTALQ
jgi:hypothetical protein